MQAVRQAVESSWRPLHSVVGAVLSDLVKAQEVRENPTTPGGGATRPTQS